MFPQSRIVILAGREPIGHDTITATEKHKSKALISYGTPSGPRSQEAKNFLLAIRNDPDNDAACLILADLPEEHDTLHLPLSFASSESHFGINTTKLSSGWRVWITP